MTLFIEGLYYRFIRFELVCLQMAHILNKEMKSRFPRKINENWANGNKTKKKKNNTNVIKWILNNSGFFVANIYVLSVIITTYLVANRKNIMIWII